MPKNETRNTFYLSYSLLMKFGQFRSYYKSKKKFKQFCQNCDLRISLGSFVFGKDKHNLYWKMKFLKQAI